MCLSKFSYLPHEDKAGLVRRPSPGGVPMQIGKMCAGCRSVGGIVPEIVYDQHHAAGYKYLPRDSNINKICCGMEAGSQVRAHTTNLTHWGKVLGSKEGVYVLLGRCRRNPYYSGRDLEPIAPPRVRCSGPCRAAVLNSSTVDLKHAVSLHDTL